MALSVNMPLKALLRQAWKIRSNNFPRQIKFVRPKNTLPISLTGESCQLNCPHCEGHYLKNMTPACNENDVKKINLDNYSSCLISGGSDKDGALPFSENEALLKELSNKNKRINLHTGLVSEEEAKKASLVDVSSFDFIVDDNIIRNIYGLDKSANDFINSYKLLSKYANVIVPHVNIGLPGSQKFSELKSLEILKKLRVDALTFIIFTPTRGTSFSDFQPPSLTYVGKVLSLARINFKKTPIFLGCMRPGGIYRERVDKIALNSGVNKIVLPTPAVRKLAVNKGLEVEWDKECCAL
ncbi:hypothetical protein [Natranaerofaba carboxydovora]|uniref:hypothetical protein n=1 Tax=Natranaerofaba carboxydovora TaxID=2742683 RepID=UPI001F14032C|nr:hypothetical protein [Natranaerofaba carboxydovora]UMZ74295.1 hypothetical protein ACONDI_01882 [Natranaerofaba carboxydovora]